MQVSYISATHMQNLIMREIKSDSSFGYILADDSSFSSMDYKVLQNQNNGLFIECVKVLYNGKTELYYITEGLRSLALMVKDMTPDMLIVVLVDILECILEVKNNGFLQCQNVAISWDKIYVNPATLKVKLVYFPVNPMQFENYGSFEGALRSEIIKMVNRVTINSNARLDQLIADLTNGMTTIKEIHNKYKGGVLEQKQRKEIAKTKESAKMMQESVIDCDEKGRVSSSASSVLRLVSVNTPEPFEAILDQPDMVMGRKRGAVDILIPFNRMIGRIHCRITNQNGVYSIKDEGSVNGTYVNGVRVPPHQSVSVKKGDFIRMADSGFKLV